MICGCDDIDYPKADYDQVLKTTETIAFKVVVHLCFETHHVDFYKKEVEYVLNVLNNDFAGKAINFVKVNPYLSNFKDTFNHYVKLSSDAKIEFKLEKILHVPLSPLNSVNVQVLNERIKTISTAVSPQDTLNIWIADLPIHGYAQYPWELSIKPEYDGVVISRMVFGRCATIYAFSQDKVLTHMVGHWLGLMHVFAQDSLITDLPTQSNPTKGNPLNNVRVWTSDMFMNFMDFSDDSARFMFTKSQIEKMRSSVYLYRKNLVKFLELQQVPAPQITKSQPIHDLWTYDALVDPPQKWNLTTRYHKMDAKIIRDKNADSGISLKRYAVAEVFLDMSGIENASLTLSFKDALLDTTVLFRTADERWHRVKIKNKTKNWETTTIPMPNPFGKVYIIRFQASNSNHYTLFNNLLVKKI